jgi:hypothetical protein
LAFSIDEKHLTARATGIATGMALLATVELSEMCSMILSFLIESPLFWSGRLSLKELGQLAGGFITTLSASPFVVSLNASRALATPQH